MPVPDGVIDSRNLCSQAVVERILGDSAVTSVKIYNTLQSDNFSAGSAGWQINRVTGSAEFQDATIRGSLNASDISAGTMSADYILGGTIDGDTVNVVDLNASNISTGTLSADRIAANSLTVGVISGGTYGNGDITFSSGSDLKSSNYVAGTSGWFIEGNGDAEFQDATIRGSLNADDLDAGTITGRTLQTAASGERVVISGSDTDRIRFYSASTQIGTIGTIGNSFLTIQSNSGSITLNAATSISAKATSYTFIFPGTSNPAFMIWDEPSTADKGQIILYDNQSATYPGYTFGTDIDTGMFHNSANQLGFAAGGNSRMVLRTDFLLFGTYAAGTAAIKADGAGSASTPTYSFGSDTTSGFYRGGSGLVAMATGGSARMYWDSNGTHLNTLTTTGTAANMFADTAAGNRIKRFTSARKYKSRISYNVDYLADIKITPAKFYRKDDKRWFLGQIADDLAEQHPLLGIYDDDGEIDNYDIGALLAVYGAKINRLEALHGI